MVQYKSKLTRKEIETKLGTIENIPKFVLTAEQFNELDDAVIYGNNFSLSISATTEQYNQIKNTGRFIVLNNTKKFFNIFEISSNDSSIINGKLQYYDSANTNYEYYVTIKYSNSQLVIETYNIINRKDFIIQFMLISNNVNNLIVSKTLSLSYNQIFNFQQNGIPKITFVYIANQEQIFNIMQAKYDNADLIEFIGLLCLNSVIYKTKLTFNESTKTLKIDLLNQMSMV